MKRVIALDLSGNPTMPNCRGNFSQDKEQKPPRTFRYARLFVTQDCGKLTDKSALGGFRTGLLVSVLFILGMLTGCGESRDEYLIGEWIWVGDAAYSYVFNYDGTGERGFPETRDPFLWDTGVLGMMNMGVGGLNLHRGNALRGEIQDETWTYVIYENTLYVTNTNRGHSDRSYSYISAITGQNPALVGSWHWADGEAFTVIFNEDGTGTRGVPGENDSFSWAADDYRLVVLRDNPGRDEIRGELWVIEVEEDRLTLDSLQVEEYFFIYNRN